MIFLLLTEEQEDLSADIHQLPTPPDETVDPDAHPHPDYDRQESSDSARSNRDSKEAGGDSKGQDSKVVGLRQDSRELKRSESKEASRKDSKDSSGRGESRDAGLHDDVRSVRSDSVNEEEGGESSQRHVSKRQLRAEKQAKVGMHLALRGANNTLKLAFQQRWSAIFGSRDARFVAAIF